MSASVPRLPLIECMYQRYLVDPDDVQFAKRVSESYTIGTLQRLADRGSRLTRRAAVLALGILADYESNAVLGRALLDEDRAVRTLAENGLRALWCRAGNAVQRLQLAKVVGLNVAGHYAEAIVRASALVDEAPWFAEAWNQRAIAYFSSGRYADSVRDCRQTLEINPYHFGAAAGMGQCYLELKQPRLALESFRRALRLNPNLEGVRAHVVALERTWDKKK